MTLPVMGRLAVTAGRAPFGWVVLGRTAFARRTCRMDIARLQFVASPKSVMRSTKDSFTPLRCRSAMTTV